MDQDRVAQDRAAQAADVQVAHRAVVPEDSRVQAEPQQVLVLVPVLVREPQVHRVVPADLLDAQPVVVAVAADPVAELQVRLVAEAARANHVSRRGRSGKSLSCARRRHLVA